MHIDLPDEVDTRINEIMRSTGETKQQTIISLLWFAVRASGEGENQELIIRYAELLRDPRETRWADAIRTILDRASPQNGVL
jgi:hypothetical protein